MAEADPKITVSVAQLRANLSRYLYKAQAGTSLVVTSRGKPIAVLGPEGEKPELPPRPLGLMKGKIWIADDFDGPMPQDFLDAYYNREL